jgi:glycosyltransferase involved in cell wall biosynthesis
VWQWKGALQLFLSVEISSYNRGHILQLVLERLARQTYPANRFEVIVSDDGSTDGTPEWIAEYVARAPYHLELVRNDHAGCGNTHNNGILRARGDVVLMIADDVLPSPRLLEEHSRMHERNPDPAVGVVGRLEQSPLLTPTPFQTTWNRIVNSIFPRNRIELDYRDFWVNNLSFKKAFMVANGMFRSWPAASHEDLELGYRLQQGGMRLLFCDEALAYHHHPETIDSVARRSYAQGYQWQLFEAHVPEAWVRARSGNFLPGDSAAARWRFRARLFARTVLFNRATIALAVPLIRKSDAHAWLAPVVDMCTAKVSSYYFRKGLVDRRRGLPFRYA